MRTVDAQRSNGDSAAFTPKAFMIIYRDSKNCFAVRRFDEKSCSRAFAYPAYPHNQTMLAWLCEPQRVIVAAIVDESGGHMPVSEMTFHNTDRHTTLEGFIARLLTSGNYRRDAVRHSLELYQARKAQQSAA